MRLLQGIVLAAGGGTRMKSELPKVLHPLCGRPMIAYVVDMAAAAGVKQTIIVLGEAADAIRPHLPGSVKVVVQKAPLGTGDAVLESRRALGGLAGDLLMLYADTPLVYRMTIQRLIEAHYKTNATCTLLSAHLADPTGYGRIVRDPTGVIVGVVEEAEANAQQRAIREINVGPLCVKAQALFEALERVKPSHVKKEWYLTQAIGILAQTDGAKLHTVRVAEAAEALGVNSRADLAKAIGVIRQRILAAHLNNGVTIVSPETTYIDHGVTIGQDTTIRPGTIIESGVSIGRRCSIGPFARLRSGVVVADDTRIGNFVELVRTTVGERVRINHVTYLGDATVEDEVNIGAGTITANYDGTSKLPTAIGKSAFIGCDTVLIAPVKVGHGAVTGAGSVIPKGHDVPPWTVVAGVPARPLATVSRKAGQAAGIPPEAPAPARPTVRKPAAPAKAKPAARKPRAVIRTSRARRRVPPKRTVRRAAKRR